MKKEKYERAELNLIRFETEDIIMVSNEYELEKEMIHFPGLLKD